VDKSVLLARKASQNTEDVDLGGGIVVKVRGLSRVEVQDNKDDEYSAVACALLDPVMTRDEVAEWLDNAPIGDMLAISEALQRLSGLDEGAQKSVVSRDGKRRGR
jgi:hypothetical protein